MELASASAPHTFHPDGGSQRRWRLRTAPRTLGLRTAPRTLGSLTNASTIHPHPHPHPPQILVATDLFARGLDIPEVQQRKT